MGQITADLDKLISVYLQESLIWCFLFVLESKPRSALETENSEAFFVGDKWIKSYFKYAPGPFPSLP